MSSRHRRTDWRALRAEVNDVLARLGLAGLGPERDLWAERYGPERFGERQMRMDVEADTDD